MMTRFPVLLNAILVWSIFIPFSIWLDSHALVQLMNALTVTTAASVLYAYWPAARVCMFKRHHELDVVDFLTLGIMCNWASILCRMGLSASLRMKFEFPPHFTPDILSFSLYLTITGGLLHLSAKQVLRGTVPVSSTPRIAFAIVSGFMVWGVLMYFSPSLDLG